MVTCEVESDVSEEDDAEETGYIQDVGDKEGCWCQHSDTTLIFVTGANVRKNVQSEV